MWQSSRPDPWDLANAAAQHGSLLPLSSSRSYPLQLPVFQQNWAFPSNFRQSYRGPYQYLPRLFQAAHHWRTSIEHASYYLASMSEDVEERGSFPGLSRHHLLQTYYELINILQCYRHHRDVSSYVRQQLNRSLVEFAPTRRHALLSRHSYKAPQLFRAYAEISGQTMSRALGNTLSEFFQKHARSILSDDLTDLAIWAHAICRSHMPDAERYDCLALIFGSCPDLVVELRRLRNPAAQEMWPVLADIADRLGISADTYRGRSRGRPMTLQRRETPTSRQLGWGTDSHSLSRSRSRDSLIPVIRYPGSVGSMITRPVSAPGRRSIIRQADRIIELADETADEAQILKEMARR